MQISLDTGAWVPGLRCLGLGLIMGNPWFSEVIKSYHRLEFINDNSNLYKWLVIILNQDYWLENSSIINVKGSIYLFLFQTYFSILVSKSLHSCHAVRGPLPRAGNTRTAETDINSTKHAINCIVTAYINLRKKLERWLRLCHRWSQLPQI